MTDQPDWPGWAPPGGEGAPGEGRGSRPAGGHEAPPRHEDVEPTDQIPTPGHTTSGQPTQRLPTDPPPPPPPPAATRPAPSWPPPGQPVYGGGGWAPPPPPRRRTGLIIAIVVGVLVLVVGAALAIGAVLVSTTTSTGSEAGGSGRVEVEGPDDREDAPQVPADDLEAQAEAVLETINASEERMIAFQEVVFSSIGDDGNVGDAAADIAQEAQGAGDDLTQMRSDLRALAGGQQEGFEGLREIRDTYAEHMDAWIDYLDAVAGSPALATPDSDEAEPLWREIEVTGDEFVGAVETGLPEDLRPDLRDLAEFIVERGFGGFDDGTTGDVV